MVKVTHRPGRTVIGLVLRLLKPIGVWGEPRYRYKYVFLFAYFWIVCLIPKVCFGYPSTEAAIRSFAELVSEMNVYFGVLMFLLWPDRFQLFIEELKSFHSLVLRDYQPEPMKEYFLKTNRNAYKCTLVYLTYMTSVCTVYCIAPLWANRSLFGADTRRDNSTTGVEFLLHFEQGFYWLNNRSSLSGYTIFTVFIVPFVAFSGYTGTTKTVAVFNTIKYCQVMLHVVVLKVKHLAHLPTTDQRVQALPDLSDMHQRALRCAELLELILQPILLIQFVLCVLIWCSLMLYFTICGMNVNFLNMLIMFLYVSIETFGCCYLGTQLSQESINVGVALYDSSWYDFDPGTQKKVAFMIMRSQRTARVTAARFCAVDMQQFGAMVQTSYSAFIVLKEYWRNQEK